MIFSFPADATLFTPKTENSVYTWAANPCLQQHDAWTPRSKDYGSHYFANIFPLET
jgi:hypothetical protein